MKANLSKNNYLKYQYYLLLIITQIVIKLTLVITLISSLLYLGQLSAYLKDISKYDYPSLIKNNLLF